MEAEKKRRTERWMAVLVLVLYILVSVGSIVVKDAFEQKLAEIQMFDMRLYFVYSILNILRVAIYMAIVLFIVIYVVFLILSYLVFIKKKEIVWLSSVAKLINFIFTVKGMSVYGVCMLLAALYFPNEQIDKYWVEEEAVFPLKVLVGQIKDMQQEPISVTVEECELTSYTYVHKYKGSNSNKYVFYISYEWEGKRYETPCTGYMLNRILKCNWKEPQIIEMYLYPNTGMVVDFAEVPLILREEKEQLETIIQQYGYPYLIELDRDGQMQICRNFTADYTYEIWNTYGEALEYDVFMIRYLGNVPFERMVDCEENPYAQMGQDGAYEVWIGKENGEQLSEKVVFEMKDGIIEYVNGNYVYPYYEDLQRME